MLTIKKISLTAALAISCLSANSQKTKLEIAPHVGYLLNGKFQGVQGTVDIRNHNSFGLTIGTHSNDTRDFEFDYTYALNTALEFRPSFPNLYSSFDTDVQIHHFSLNYISYLADLPTIHPFLNVGAGVAYFNVLDDRADDETFLSFNFGLGSKFDINERMGVRVQIRYMAPLVFEGVGIYAGVGTGGVSSGVSTNASVPLSQFDMRAGVYFRLGN